MAKAKEAKKRSGKSFLDSKGAEETKQNPINNFLGEEEPERKPSTKRSTPARKAEPPAYTDEKPPKGYRIDPRFMEVKSKRVQFVFQPSLLERFKAESARRNTSMNDLMHVALKRILPTLEAEEPGEE